MRMSKLIGDRFKERPAECKIESHSIMVRGGYIKQVNTGSYSLYNPAKRITRKIEEIIREEMDAVDGQEVLFPVVLPAALWKESGRFESVGEELLRLKDRSGSEMVLGMTHEEASVHLVRELGSTYNKYPFMIYQIQTKFRDEPRSRGGLLRVREFTMKDAYSFHTSQEDLEQYYQRCHRAYERIFARAGVPEVISVLSDSGMMGGNVSHEFMLLTDIGEDTLAICGNCDYKSNMEVAECIIGEQRASDEGQALEKVSTPGVATIEDVCRFFKVSPDQTAKAVVYQKNQDDSFVVVFIRGDLDVNETKLRNLLKEEIHPAASLEGSGLNAGSIGPLGLPEGIPVVADRSLQGAGNLICGANDPEHHYQGLRFERDFPGAEFVDVAKIYSGAVCPKCGKPSIEIRNGIEVGNIFQLGDKYTKPMDMKYVDSEGDFHYPIMGCYGIGVGRLMASVCEAKRDDYGPIWPISIAPWTVHICTLRVDQPEIREAAERLYEQLQKAGIDVLYDDRDLSAGVKFSDADLLGVPIRIIVSPKNFSQGKMEVVTRDKRFSEKVDADQVLPYLRGLIEQLTEELTPKD